MPAPFLSEIARTFERSPAPNVVENFQSRISRFGPSHGCVQGTVANTKTANSLIFASLQNPSQSCQSYHRLNAPRWSSLWKGLLLLMLFLCSGDALSQQTQQTQQPSPMHSVLEGGAVQSSEPKKDIKTPVRPKPVASSVKAEVSTDDSPTSVDAGSEIDELLTGLVLKHLPHDFAEDKDWGRQAERFDGLKVRRKGLGIRTKRKKKMVNHGSWKKYNVSLLNPKDKFAVSIKNMREIPDEKLAFDLHCRSDLKIDARLKKWLKGVQLYSLSVDGKATVSLVVTIELETVLDFSRFPPDLIFRPVATAADLNVEEFRIDRISKVGGEVAQQATAWAREALDKKIAGEEVKLVKKINESLKKEAPKLRLSLHDAVSSKWAPIAKDFLPEDVQEAADSSEQ